jgi:hypothetical protein
MTSSTRRWGASCLGLAALTVTLAAPRAARAHIDLTRPVPREQGRPVSVSPNSNLKQGPCGQVVNGRTEKVSVFAPGETIEVTWRETTNHASYYRVAFDREGDDAFPMFEGPGAGTQGIDPNGPCPVDGQVILAYLMEDGVGGSHTLQVRLPDVECEGCTLQVIQFMYDTGKPYYFQCADLALRRGDAGTPGPASSGAGSLPAVAEARDAGLDAALDPAIPTDDAAAAAGCWSRIAPLTPTPTASAGASGEGSAPPVANDPAPAASAVGTDGPEASLSMTPRRKDGGCSFDTLPSSRNTGAASLLLLGASLMFVRARRAVRAAPSRSALPPGEAVPSRDSSARR